MKVVTFYIENLLLECLIGGFATVSPFNSYKAPDFLYKILQY